MKKRFSLIVWIFTTFIVLVAIFFLIFWSINGRKIGVNNIGKESSVILKRTIDGGCCGYKNYDIVSYKKVIPKIGDIIIFDTGDGNPGGFNQLCGSWGLGSYSVLAGKVLALPGDTVFFGVNGVKINGSVSRDESEFLKRFSGYSGTFLELNSIKYNYSELLNKEIKIQDGYYLISGGAGNYCDRTSSATGSVINRYTTSIKSDVFGVIIEKTGHDTNAEYFDSHVDY